MLFTFQFGHLIEGDALQMSVFRIMKQTGIGWCEKQHGEVSYAMSMY